jgi:membrane-anchored protein YejM (alkaline phosphatase superfamily)
VQQSLPRLGTRVRLAGWISRRWAGYTAAIVSLALNVPFMAAGLSRYPQDLQWNSAPGAYTLLVFAGYYVFLIAVLLTLVFVLIGAWPRLFTAASTTILALALCYFAIDGVVYRVAKAHIDAFWLQYLVTTFEGLGIGLWQITGAVLVFTAILALELFLLRTARRVRRRTLWSAGLAAVCIVCFAITQAIHIVAYEVSDTRFTSITPQLPFYFPMRSHRNAMKYGRQLALIHESEVNASGTADASLHYPLRDAGCGVRADRDRKNVLVLLVESWRADVMDSVTSPRLSAFARDASTFLDHFSSGNSTPSGVFPLFYGIHSTYWKSVKANNVRIHNPVLIDALQDNGYAFGIFAKSDFKAHKIKEAVFRDIDVEESFRGATAHENDRDMTDRLFAFMAAQRASRKPFFGFAFYKSTHYDYDYPADSAPFQPARKLNVVRASAGDDPTPMRNDYRNAAHYVDGLIGDLLQRMRAAGLLENTIVIVTGDHGEEFNDNHDNTWMHGGNFSEYQTRVPLIVYAPGKPGRRILTATSEVDIAPTILQEALHCGWNARDYSNGFNLFGPLPERRPIVAASYIHHALILGDKVFVIWPMYVQRYDLKGRKTVTGWPDAQMMQEAMEEITRFYAPLRPGAPVPATANLAAPTVAKRF